MKKVIFTLMLLVTAVFAYAINSKVMAYTNAAFTSVDGNDYDDAVDQLSADQITGVVTPARWHPHPYPHPQPVPVYYGTKCQCAYGWCWLIQPWPVNASCCCSFGCGFVIP
jgi:hypothetical protein